MTTKTALSSSNACRTTIQENTPSPHESSSVAANVNSRTSRDAIERGSVRFEDITDAADCVHEFRFEWIVHLRPQPTHNNIDNVGVGLEADVPNVLGDLGAGNDFSSRPHQMLKQFEFLRREIELRA